MIEVLFKVDVFFDYMIYVVGICYLDISLWVLLYFVFVVFNVLNGVEVCYWIVEGDFVWVFVMKFILKV